ncbi:MULTISPECIES: glycosyltransferase family 2 protein [Pseudomonas]|uniref:glycosyltransferase family 2 protein n=2 Tax=Pseudomonas TaxID=286 RepID=UPI00223F9B38|nr:MULTISPECIES: glycosyltransferase [Pseudomonas]UZM91954.1 glycosyltransferase [Pseudomonas putida DOT-T1E]WPO28749.1 glycosyltransferase [Pseudomonas sp. BO3-4]
MSFSSRAQTAFRNGDYQLAVDLYERAALEQPALTSTYLITLNIARGRLGLPPVAAHQLVTQKLSLESSTILPAPPEYNSEYRSTKAEHTNSLPFNDVTTEPLVSVILTASNQVEYIEESITSILRQKWKNLELVIVDNNSTDGTWYKIQRLLKTVSNLRCKRLNTDLGEIFSKKVGIQMSRGNYIFFQRGYDLSHPDRIHRSMQHLMQPGTQCVRNKIHYFALTDDQPALPLDHLSSLESYVLGVRRSIFNPILNFGQTRASEHDHLVKILISLGQSAEEVFELDTPLYCRSSPRAQFIDSDHDGDLPPSNAHPLLTRPRCFVPAQPVVVSLCSIPERAELLRQVLASLAPQVDAMHVYLDRYDSIPDFVRNCHPQVTAYLSKDHPGLRDNGKFLAFSTLAEDCYYFTADDDIVYPPDYVASMVRRIEDYERQAVIGVHGVLLPEQAEGYFTSFRKVHMFKKELERDALVNNLGTGTVAFHSGLLRGLDLTHFGTPGMADLHLSVFCKQRDIPMVALARPEDWLQELPSPNTSLYNEFRQADDQQSALIRAHKPWGYAAISKAVAGASMRATKPDTGERLQRLIPLLHACLK